MYKLVSCKREMTIRHFSAAITVKQLFYIQNFISSSEQIVAICMITRRWVWAMDDTVWFLVFLSYSAYLHLCRSRDKGLSSLVLKNMSSPFWKHWPTERREFMFSAFVYLSLITGIDAKITSLCNTFPKDRWRLTFMLRLTIVVVIVVDFFGRQSYGMCCVALLYQRLWSSKRRHIMHHL